MAFQALTTLRLKLPYFAKGNVYSAEGDRRRFFYLEYNLQSYVGIVGVGLIEGWDIVPGSGLSVSIGYGTSICGDFFSESPFIVKRRQDVLPTDIVIETDYFIDTPVYDWTPPLNYDPDIYGPQTPVVQQVTHYDKILYPSSIQLLDNSDNYIYIYRNSAFAQLYPYYVPDNVSPVAETYFNQMPLKTAVAYGATPSLGYATNSSRLLIGKVVTRNGQITKIDYSGIKKIKDLQATLSAFGDLYVSSHIHGGSRTYDPQKINLKTDIRNTILESSTDTSSVYRVLYSEPSSVSLNHEHYFFVNAKGDGATATIIGDSSVHYHKISGYTVGDSISSDSSVTSHTHSISLSSQKLDPWVDTGGDVLYINDKLYSGSRAFADPSNKTVSFSGDVLVTKRSFSVEKKYSDGYTYSFQSDESTVYRFMLRMSVDFYSRNFDDISSGKRAPIILPDASSSADDLKNQCSMAEIMMQKTGDSFTFMDVVAPDPVTVTLQREGHIDNVILEIVSNSEVSGILKTQNILYIDASKIKLGIFDIGKIPVLSHVGRYLEECNFTKQRTVSKDGYSFTVSSQYPFGNNKDIYSVYYDGSAYLLSTSDGMMRYPTNGAYYFVINGADVYVDYGNLYSCFSLAVKEYEGKTGKKFSFTSALYSEQILQAEKVVLKYGDFFKFTGSYTLDKGTAVFDVTCLFYVDGYRLPNFGYTVTKSENDVIDGEEIVSVVSSATSESEASDVSSTVIVKNDFNRSTVKKIIVESDYSNVYGGLGKQYFAVSSDFLCSSVNVNSSWNQIFQSSLIGYIKDVTRMYGSKYLTYGSNGVFVCLNNTLSEFKKIALPISDSNVDSCSFGYDGSILYSNGNSIFLTQDLGKTWSSSSLQSSSIRDLFFDIYRDKTSVFTDHHHTLMVDQYGNGYTVTTIGSALDHSHIIKDGIVLENDSHSHICLRNFYYADSQNYLYESSNGLNWTLLGQVSSEFGEVGQITSCFGKFFATTYSGLISSADGVTWTPEYSFQEPIFSFSWNDDMDLVYLGGKNDVYKYDGIEFTSLLLFDGVGRPITYVDSVKRNFGYTINNRYAKIDFLGKKYISNKIDVVYDYSSCRPLHGSWGQSSFYEIYVDQSLVKSTKPNYETSSANISVSPSSGLISLSAKGSKKDLNLGDESIELSDSSIFPSEGYVRVQEDSGKYAIIKYVYNISNSLFLDNPSIVSSRNSSVELINNIGADSSIFITIYEGKLYNVGKNSHSDIENLLSTKDCGSPKGFSDTYLSNLLHLTVALKYVIPGIDKDYKNTFTSLFDYNDIVGDENNINRFIDIPSSNFYSQSSYSSKFLISSAKKINRFIFGFGNFSDLLFCSTDLGLFVSKNENGYGANWFQVPIIDSETGLDLSSCYDVCQVSPSRLIVCSNVGVFLCDDSNFKVWTKNQVSKVAVFNRINMRWDGSVSHNYSGYWWQNWSGLVNTNPSMVNSVVISGVGISYISNDYGNSWSVASITSSGYSVKDYVMSDLSRMDNGLAVACVVGKNNEFSKILQSNTLGDFWYSVFGYPTNSGQLTSSSSLTDFNNTKLGVSIDIPSSTLRGLSLVFSGKSFDIIDNYSGSIVVRGQEALSLYSSGVKFSVVPPYMHCVCSLSEGNIIVGTNNGILNDYGSLSGRANGVSSVIKDVGVRAVVTQLSIRGSLKNFIFSTSDSASIIVYLDRFVKKNELTDYLMSANGFSPIKILSNESSLPDGTVVVNVENKWDNYPKDLKISLSDGKNIMLFVSFLSDVKDGYLSGGKLFFEPNTDLGVPDTKNSLYFSIVSNKADQLTLSLDGVDENIKNNLDLYFSKDSSLLCSRNGFVPIYIDSPIRPSPGSLRGSLFDVLDVSSTIKCAEVKVVDNSELVLFVEEECSVKPDLQDSSKNYTAYTCNCFVTGQVGNNKGVSFLWDKSFNSQITSVDLSHSHKVSLFGKTISGTVSSFGGNTATYVDINIGGSSGLDIPPFVGNPTLLSGQRIIFYDVNFFAHSYESKIISTSSTSIRVENSGDIFDFSSTDSSKVSIGYVFYIDSSYYGFSGAPEFSRDFVVFKDLIVSDLFVGGQTVTVNDSSLYHVGENIVIKANNGALHKSSVKSIPSSTTIVINDKSLFDFFVSDDSFCEVLFSEYDILSEVLLSDSLVGEKIIHISDTSNLRAGDVVSIKNIKGSSFSSTIESIINSSSFQIYDSLPVDFYVLDSSSTYITRYNYSDSHIHLVKSGEVSSSENDSWYKMGYNLYHSHLLSSYVDEVLDIKTIDGKTFVVGNSNSVYSSVDGAINWALEKKFDEDIFGEISVNKISFNEYDIVFSADSGRIISLSSTKKDNVIPLEIP